MIIGLTGMNAAGKGTVVDFFKERGYSHHSVRSYLTADLERNGQEPSRQSMQLRANELRKQNGADYLIRELYRTASEIGGNAIIESFRCPGEIQSLRTQPQFILLAIDANPQVRYQRAIARGSSTDGNLTLEKFLEDEKRELDNKDPFEQNLSTCMKLADIILLNEGTIPEFYTKLENYSSFDSEGFLKRRPSRDETFMRTTYTWAASSTCLRRKVGAVISTPDHAEVSQGYNGSPRGIPNCIDLGFCERQRKNVPSGQRLEECQAVHAEPNAIINAGNQGKSVKGDILYSTTFPCQICAGIIINAGISEIIYEADYPNDSAKATLAKAKTKLRKFEGVRARGFDKLFRQE